MQMTRSPSHSAWRASALAAALFAVTLNFLQPLVQAALTRDGSPEALWKVFCNSASRDAGQDDTSAPATGAHDHECCLGLAHAPALAVPSPDFVRLALVATAVAFLPATGSFTPVGIRDGPARPRGPPSPV